MRKYAWFFGTCSSMIKCHVESIGPNKTWDAKQTHEFNNLEQQIFAHDEYDEWYSVSEHNM